MPDFFQINLEQMLSELRLHESNTQALFNALEGEKAVADYRKRYQNSEPQYEGNTAQKKVPNTAECDIIKSWINK